MSTSQRANGWPSRPTGVQALRNLTVPALAALPAPARRTVLHAFGRYAPWEEGFDFTPPVAHRGEVLGPPDFVGIGVQKAGTTWWYDLITAHPQVSRRADIHKERHFFDRYAASSFGSEDCMRYHGWFPRPPGMVTGEWTPDYMHFAWVPALLAVTAPDVRLLVLLRDPVERFRSGLSHHRQHRGRLSAEVWADAVARGFYDEELMRWADHFPSERILVLQYEHCVLDPVGQLARTYDFLGLPQFRPEGIAQRVSATSETVSLDDDARYRLVELYTPGIAALARNQPELELDLWPNFSGAATLMRLQP